MPLACIEVRKAWSPEQVQAIIDAVYQAQVEALQLPASDRQLRYIEHLQEHFQVPAEKTENYTLVQIDLFSGRSLDAKRKLYRLIVEKLGLLGIGAADVFIVLREIPLENWGIQGGKPASEVHLGFEVNV